MIYHFFTQHNLHLVGFRESHHWNSKWFKGLHQHWSLREWSLFQEEHYLHCIAAAAGRPHRHLWGLSSGIQGSNVNARKRQPSITKYSVSLVATGLHWQTLPHGRIGTENNRRTLMEATMETRWWVSVSKSKIKALKANPLYRSVAAMLNTLVAAHQVLSAATMMHCPS